MARQYKILSDTDMVLLEEKIGAQERRFKGFRVEGFTWDGTNYLVLVSYEL